MRARAEFAHRVAGILGGAAHENRHARAARQRLANQRLAQATASANDEQREHGDGHCWHRRSCKTRGAGGGVWRTSSDLHVERGKRP